MSRRKEMHFWGSFSRIKNFSKMGNFSKNQALIKYRFVCNKISQTSEHYWQQARESSNCKARERKLIFKGIFSRFKIFQKWIIFQGSKSSSNVDFFEII